MVPNRRESRPELGETIGISSSLQADDASVSRSGAILQPDYYTNCYTLYFAPYGVNSLHCPSEITSTLPSVTLMAV